MSVALLGFGWDASSSYAQGAAMGPRTIEALLYNEASSSFALDGTDVSRVISVHEFPVLPADPAKARATIELTVASTLQEGHLPLSLGGDHSITYPILRAFKEKYGAVNVLHIDAHMDMHEQLKGDRYSHASPFARALDDGCIAKLVQIGIRSASLEQRARAAKFEVLSLGADGIDQIPSSFFEKPMYLSIDLDGLDPAFAPGVSHPEPGGLSTRELLSLIQCIKGKILGADIVELNPERDHNLQTAGVAVRLIKEIAAKMVSI
jgi:arginase